MVRKSIKFLALTLFLVTLNIQSAHASVSDINSIEDNIYNHLKNWDTEFEIPYFNYDVIDIIRKSAAKDDYLSKSLIGLRVKGYGNNSEVSVEYRTTKSEEDYIDNEIKTPATAIINSNMSDYEKVKAVNDYLVNRYDYDHTLQSNNSYLALTTGRTTCQGYSMTAYKMFNMVGIENRIVIGSINGVPHAWNEVNVDGKWYNIDITNDDYVGSYKYFLKSDATFMSSGFEKNSETEYQPCSEDYVIS